MLYSCTHMATVGVKGLSERVKHTHTHRLHLRIQTSFDCLADAFAVSRQFGVEARSIVVDVNNLDVVINSRSRPVCDL